MATVFKKAWTAPLPPNAEIATVRGSTTAFWSLRNGERRTAEAFKGAGGRWRIRGETATYVAKYRDASGVWREVPTGCRDETAAKAVLARLERRSELVRAGVVTPEEDAAAAHGRVPLEQHVQAYVAHLRLKGGAPHRIRQVEARLNRVFRECRLTRLSDLTVPPIEAWLARQERGGSSAATRNELRLTLVGFGNWCVRSGRLVGHKLGNLPRGDVKADRRHVRRALTEDELERLLEAARSRPLEEALTVRRGARKGALAARIRPHVQARLEATGRERALVYKTLVLTGLRKGELASITIAQAILDGPRPHLVLEAADEKNRDGSLIPLRDDLAADLSAWLGERLRLTQAEAARLGQVAPDHLPPTAPLLNVPDGLSRLMNRDLVRAGIARMETRGGRSVVLKIDARGRTVDVHALRTTFGSHLAKAGVPLRTAQAAMRHSDPALTAAVYQDPRMLDVAGAIEALPSLALGR